LITATFADWQFESVFEHTASGFYAVAFKNSVSGEKVLAFRGSQSIGSAEGNKDWTDDIVFGIFNEASAQMADALAATEKFLSQNGGDKSNITLTGHSLGGGLAVFASNMYNIKAVTFDSAPTSSVGYYYFPALAALSFRGVDATMYEEHINEHDPIGLLEFSRRNGVKHKNMIDVDKITDVFEPHGRNTIVTEENGSVVLSSAVDVNKVKPYTEAVGLHNEALILAANSPAITLGSVIIENILYPKGSLTMGSSTGDYLFGNTTGGAGLNVAVPHTDVIYGGDGNDKLYGMLGDDYFIGGNGNDEMKSDGGNDTYFYYKGQGTDTIYDGSGNDKIYLLGFDKNEKITVDSKSDEKWIFIKYGGETIIKIRNYQDQFFGNSLTHSFEVFTENSKDGIKIMDWGKATSVKKIKIACPVSVTVLDVGGNELVTLNDYETDTVDLDEGFFSVEKDGETGEYIKILNLFDDSGCSIRINGLDSGSMDVQVSYTTEKGNELYSGSKIPVQYNGVHTLEVAEDVKLTDSDGSEISLEKQVYVPVQTVTAEKVTVKKGKTKNAVYEVDPVDATCGEISFISSNPQIATVDENGTITGVSVGTVQMTVQVDDKLVVFDVEVRESGFNIVIIICIIIAVLAVVISVVSLIIYLLNNKKNK
ncbi:MAG: Ig-like domain-containing protein, partial [Candidatus Fimenecus sp.]